LLHQNKEGKKEGEGDSKGERGRRRVRM